jgi:hypothetical protein
VEQRLRTLESSSTARVGDYVLSQTGTDLAVSKPGAATFTLNNIPQQVQQATTALAATSAFDWTTLFTELGIPKQTAAALATWLQQIIGAINKLFNPNTSGLSNDPFSIITNGLAALQGQFNTFIDNLDGTLGLLPGTLDNGDGTFTILVDEAFTALETGDGTVMNTPQLVRNFIDNDLKTGQQILDMLVTQLSNAPGIAGTQTGNNLATLGAALTAINVVNITGYQTGTNLGETFQQTWDAVSTAFGHLPAGASLSDIINAGTMAMANLAQAVEMGQGNSTYVAQMAVNNPIHHAVDPSLTASFDLGTFVPQQTIDVVPGIAVSSYIWMNAGMIKNDVAWQGWNTTGLTGARANVYDVDLLTGVETLVGETGDVLSSIGSDPTNPWIYAPLTIPITVTQLSCYRTEIQVEGDGTHTMLGYPDHPLAPNSNVFPPQMGAIRTSQTTPTNNSVGTPGHGTGTATASITPVNVGDYIVAQVTGYGAVPTGCTYDGTPMTLVTGVDLDNIATNGALQFYGIYAPSTAPASIVATSAGNFVTVNAMGYADVADVSSGPNNYGSGSALTVAVEGIAGTLMVAGFGAENLFGGAQTMTFSLGNQRIYDATATAADTVIYIGGDSDALGTTGFSSSLGSFITNWGAISLRLIGTTIFAPVSIPSPTYSSIVPWVAMSSESTSTHGVQGDTQTFYGASGSHTYDVPPWAAHVDIIVLGAGGGGQSEQGYNEGQGGMAGHWAGVTLEVGVDVAASAALSVTVGAGGAHPTFYWEDGSPGEASTVSWTPLGGSTVTSPLTGAGGAGGTTEIDIFNYDGQAAGDFTWNGKKYQGGLEAGINFPGNAPGGGGGGAVFFLFGANGADGGVWIVARQT